MPELSADGGSADPASSHKSPDPPALTLHGMRLLPTGNSILCNASRPLQTTLLGNVEPPWNSTPVLKRRKLSSLSAVCHNHMKSFGLPLTPPPGAPRAMCAAPGLSGKTRPRRKTNAAGDAVQMDDPMDYTGSTSSRGRCHGGRALGPRSPTRQASSLATGETPS